MTQQDYAHHIILADRTGSMGAFADPPHPETKAEISTKGIHDYITAQAALPGKSTFTLVEFDSYAVTTVASFAHPSTSRELREWTCRPGSSTPLLDAMGTTITQAGEALASMPEDQRPDRVYFLVSTDGLENASKEYTLALVNELVTRQRETYKWEFVFIGADIDAFAEAGSMGMAQGSTMSTHGAGLAAAYAGTTQAVTRSRASGQSVSYTKGERDAAGKKDKADKKK